MQILGTNIAKTVRALGWTLKDLGDRSGMARSCVSQIVHGHANATVATAEKLSSALGVPLCELFRVDYEPAKIGEHAIH